MDHEQSSERRLGCGTRVGIAVGACVILLLAAGIILPWLGRRWANNTSCRLHGERVSKMLLVSESLQRYRAEHGRYPRGADDWLEFDPSAEGLVAAPELSIRGDYVVDFDVLCGSGDGVVIVDPGLSLYSFKSEMEGRTWSQNQLIRRGLFKSGDNLWLLKYDYENGRVIMSCGTWEQEEPWPPE